MFLLLGSFLGCRGKTSRLLIIFFDICVMSYAVVTVDGGSLKLREM